MIGEASLTRARSRSRSRLLASFDPSAIYTRLDQGGIAAFYPEFRSWFFGKVIPGLEAGERQIIEAIIDGELAGLAICKRDVAERKLCTLWVSPILRNRGIATSLAYKAFEWLGTDRPLFTVPEESVVEFSSLLRTWRFSAPLVYQKLYRPTKSEYVFNGFASTATH